MTAELDTSKALDGKETRADNEKKAFWVGLKGVVAIGDLVHLETLVLTDTVRGRDRCSMKEDQLIPRASGTGRHKMPELKLAKRRMSLRGSRTVCLHVGPNYLLPGLGYIRYSHAAGDGGQKPLFPYLLRPTMRATQLPQLFSRDLISARRRRAEF